MTEHTIHVLSPTADGERISGWLLRDILDLVAEGSRRALRMRVEGRSIAQGKTPAWLDQGAAFDFVGLADGSCVVQLRSPTLAQAVPERFAQRTFFLDHDTTAIGLWRESLADALAGRADSELFDGGMLAEFEEALSRIFASAVEALEIRNGQPAAGSLLILPEGVERIRHLRSQTPPSRRVRVAGKLDAICHTDRRFTLILPEGPTVTGIAEGIVDRVLQTLWGEPAVVSGLAVFRPSGALLRIEADRIAPATERDLEIWSGGPEPLETEIDPRSLRKPQGSRSGIGSILGRWPGDETDEEIAEILEDIS